MRKLFLAFLTLTTLTVFGQIGTPSYTGVWSNMNQSASTGTTTWNLVNPNPILPTLVVRGTESWTLHTHKMVLPNYTLPKSQGLPDRLMFIDGVTGEVKVSDSNPFDSRYLQSFTETDPNVPSYAKSLTGFNIIKSSTDALYQPIGSYLTSESDPTIYAWAKASVKPSYTSSEVGAYPLTGNPSGFLTSFTESDPTVPSYSKSLSAFSVIKSSTDPLYKPIGYAPSNTEVISALGFTPYNSTNPSGYITNSSTGTLTNKSGNISQWTNDSGYLTSVNSGQVTGALGYTPVTNARTITINGTAQDLTTNRSWTVGDLLSTGSYANPSWISSLAYSKLTGTPTIPSNTSQITESGNLYYTDARARAAITVTTTGTGAATYSGGVLNIPTPSIAKRQLTYSGVTDASGNYTVTFATPFSVAPNIQQNLIGGSALQGTLITSVTTTGFTIQAYTRSTVSSLPIIGTLTGLLVGAATNPLVGGAIDVLVTEK